MADVSSCDLRNRTADVLRRVEAGERLRVGVNGHPVAELVPLSRPPWAPGPSMERVLRDARADADLTRSRFDSGAADRIHVPAPAILDTSILMAKDSDARPCDWRR